MASHSIIVPSGPTKIEKETTKFYKLYQMFYTYVEYIEFPI